MSEDWVRRRLDEGYLLTGGLHAYHRYERWPEHTHDAHELLWCEQGGGRIDLEGRSYPLAPGLGAWVPAGVPHQGHAVPGTELVCVFVSSAAIDLTGPRPVAVSRAFSALTAANREGEIERDARIRLQQVILDLLEDPVPAPDLALVLPTSPTLLRIADGILADPADTRTTAQWARSAGMNERTLARRFMVETGLSLTQWRITVRVRQALGDLALGEPVRAVAGRLGYRTLNTFAGHFRGLVGILPGEYARHGFDPPRDRTRAIPRELRPGSEVVRPFDAATRSRLFVSDARRVELLASVVAAKWVRATTSKESRCPHRPHSPGASPAVSCPVSCRAWSWPWP